MRICILNRLSLLHRQKLNSFQILHIVVPSPVPDCGAAPPVWAGVAEPLDVLPPARLDPAAPPAAGFDDTSLLSCCCRCERGNNCRIRLGCIESSENRKIIFFYRYLS